MSTAIKLLIATPVGCYLLIVERLDHLKLICKDIS